MLMKARHLGPHEEPKPVRPVEPAWIFRLLVLASPVEPKGLGELDVASQVFIARRGHPAAWEIALVEYEALDVGLSVQQELPVPRLDLAHSEIALDAVCLHAVQAQQSDLEVVEDRRIGRPRGDRIQLHATVAGPPGPGSDDFPIQPRDQLETAFPANPEVASTFGKVRPDPDARDVAVGQPLAPPRLPHSRRGGVEESPRPPAPVLPAARQGFFVGAVLRAE